MRARIEVGHLVARVHNDSPLHTAHDTADHPVFGKPLKESLRYASVQISTADANGELYVWGFIPVVVAKWCVSSFISTDTPEFV